MDNQALAKVYRRGIELLIQAASGLTDEQRKEVPELHEPWQAGVSYGTNQYLKYGIDAAGRAVLYRTTKNVNSATTTPDATPGSYAKV